jgi:hypothetical protein
MPACRIGGRGIGRNGEQDEMGRQWSLLWNGPHRHRPASRRVPAGGSRCGRHTTL